MGDGERGEGGGCFVRITYQPEADGRAAYTVDSDSGATYAVRYMGTADGDENTALWECNCMAGKHGRMCKHVRAVIAAANDDSIPPGTVIGGA